MSEYTVEGYGERKDYDGPYHPNADFDPKLVFKYAGDCEKQEQWQNDLLALDGKTPEPEPAGDVQFTFDLGEDDDE